MTKVSIIIPTIGRETLPKVLEDLRLCEGYAEINPEVLVVFDGEQTCEAQNVRVLETKQKVFAGGARNLGLDHTTGEIIIFLQDDTYPDKNWLQKHIQFHLQNPEQGSAYLGKVEWTPELAHDSLHQWLLNHAQFRFHKIKKHGATWKNFYTSNISLKRGLIGNKRFNTGFKGWGFEDIEFGYQLKEDLKLIYDEDCKVYHDHPQTFEKVIENTRNAHKNAVVFEKLHSVKILPRGLKRFTLQTVILLLSLVPKFLLPQKTYWWREWKKSWIKGFSDQA